MALPYLGVTPTQKEEKPKNTKGQSPVAEAAAAARGGDPADEAYKIVSEGREPATPITSEPPKKKRPTKVGEVEVPELVGYPVRAAILKASSVGLVPQIEGTGRVVRQEPPAGTISPKGTTLKLVFEPPT